MQEAAELDLLNKKNGVVVETKLFGRKKLWKAAFFPLGLMDMQSRLYHKLEIDYKGTTSEIVGKNVKHNAKICAEIIAITLLAKPWKIRLFKWWMKRHILWNVDSGKLWKFTNDLFIANAYKGFITSIELMSVNKVTAPTEANPIEGSEAHLE